VTTEATGHDPLIGQVLGHYRVLEKIGAGGMGVVYRARDEHLDREVAIKLLRPGTLTDSSARHRFHNEARALSKLNHSNIATIHDFDSQDGTDFLVMELLTGKPLSSRLVTGPLPEFELLPLALQLTEGLVAAHSNSIIHRDLKPANLFLTPDSRLKILDFGLARLRMPPTDTITVSELESHSVSGTFPYMPPEQVLGRHLDARTDLYAAGLILYEMATGQRPFAELPAGKLLDAILHRAPISPRALNPKVSRELESIILKCLEKDPANRYQAARELAVDLRRLLRDSSAGAIIASVTRRLPVLAGRRKTLIAPLVAIFLLAVCAAIFFLLRTRGLLPKFLSGTPQIQSVAVLPLANLSGDPQREFFADGVTEELISQLGRNTNLRVISRQSVMQFKNTALPLKEIARRLDVDAIIEGSVLQSGDRVRVTARLVSATTDRQIWGDEYERDVRDVLPLQAEVTEAIARGIKLKLSPEDRARLASTRPVDPEAYEAYLKGRSSWFQISKSSNEEAERYFQIALDKDPNFALAYAGLADVWLMRTDTGYLAPSEVVDKAKALAKKAIELDPSLAEPHVSLGNIDAGLDHDWAAAERHFQRAIQANPSHANAHFMYADLLISLHRNAEWDVEIHRALALDPMDYYFRAAFYGWHLIYLRRYDEAIETLKGVLSTNPDFSSAHMGLWGAYYKKHMDKEAYAEAVRFYEVIRDQEAVEAMHTGWTAGGYREAMKRAGDVLAARAEHKHVPGVRIARLYAHAGQNDLALTWLERATNARESPLEHLAVAWDWETLYPDPRFQELLQRLHLPR